MRNAVKILCAGAENTHHAILYADIPVSESVMSMLFPVSHESLCIEIVSTPYSIRAPDYYTKMDMYAYAKDGETLFALTPLSLRSDKVAISPEFFVRLKAFLSTYFDSEVCKLNAKLADSKRKHLHLAEFYFKHGFYAKAQFFSDKLLKSSWPRGAEKAAVLENKVWMRILEAKGVDRRRVLETIKLYGTEVDNALVFIIEMGNFVNLVDFVFLTRQVDAKKVMYLQRVYFFHECARLFKRQGRHRLAVSNYINAYFSLQDGYNMDFKAYLYHQALSLVGKDRWRQVVESVLERVRSNEDENVKMSTKKSISTDLSYTTKYCTTQHTEFFSLDVTSFDNVVCFNTNSSVYVGSDVFGENVVYYLDNVRLEVLCKEEGVEIMQLGGFLIDREQRVNETQLRSIDVFKTLRRGCNIINVPFDSDIMLKTVKFRVGGAYSISATKNVKLMRVQPVFAYRVMGLEFDTAGNFSLSVQATGVKNKNPKVLCLGVEGNVVFDRNGLCRVQVLYTHSPCKCIEILCEVAPSVYKKYAFAVPDNG